jgi:hypothetical protein
MKRVAVKSPVAWLRVPNVWAYVRRPASRDRRFDSNVGDGTYAEAT